ncbi:MAG: DUF3320 domain-containing protein [Blastocatellia bacterium]|nr:DUF3320 domain-containing protein [Blastocatellia bacterium]
MTVLPNASLDPTDPAKTNATIENWKRKLLDLTKRNRALNFKPDKVATVTIVDELPGEVFRQLCLTGRAMKFLAAPAQAPARTVLPARETDLDQGDWGLAQNFAPYEVTRLAVRHTDDALQTTAQPEQLDKSLRRIAQRALESLEEQGVNTLFLALGMLHYREPGEPQVDYRAPLVLVPVELNRKSARSGYTVRMTDEEPIVNPALVEYLRRNGVNLPTLPDSSEMEETYDLQIFFKAVVAEIERQLGWQVTTDMYLAFFSFQKLLLFKDLEVNSTAFANHRLVQQIIHRNGAGIFNLPDAIRKANLDQVFPPESTAQVVNADSSQLRAILAASRGCDLVIEGPPGTGKSQTITNLIAQALRENKTVLFVAEKMAALAVVHQRLLDAGLGEFCLELHSTKSSKREVMQQLKNALDASLERTTPNCSEATRLAAVRENLTTYARDLHAPFGAAGFSPFQVIGLLETVRSAPRCSLSIPVETVSRDAFLSTQRDLQNLAEAARNLGHPTECPWRDATKSFYSEDDVAGINQAAGTLRKRLEQVFQLATEVETRFGVPPIRTWADLEVASGLANLLTRSPGAPPEVLQSNSWNAPPAPALALIERGRAARDLQTRIRQKFTDTVWETDHAADIALVEEKENSPLRFLNFLSGRFNAIKKRWATYRQPSYQPTLVEQANDMRGLERLRRERQELGSVSTQGSQLFGPLWNGPDSDWEGLAAYTQWVVEFRRFFLSHRCSATTLEVAGQIRPDLAPLHQLCAETELVRAELISLRQQIGWPTNYLAEEGLSDLFQRISDLRANLAQAPRWATYETLRAKVAAGSAGELLPFAVSGSIGFDQLVPVYLRGFYQRWLNQVFQERASLRGFTTTEHESRIRDFRELDQSILLQNRLALIEQRREHTQTLLRTPETAAGLSFLRRQFSLQRGLSPLRVTFQQSLPAIRAIKPVFLMSPLSAAQLIEARDHVFDLVIFDEASQLPTEDAVGSILRGKQLIVVGDPKQLPPTNFFSVMNGTIDAPRDESGLPLFEDSESILEEFLGSGTPHTRLRWHYRSAHESLIAFSNVSFYESDLLTFPSVETAAGGLSFEYIPQGYYEGKGLNPVEARRVADAVVHHARTFPEISLGVGTFNLRQQIAIQDELELRRRNDPTLEPFFARSKKEPFFVKNLENIQGDERDVIFLSVTYARNAEGMLRYNFGPLNGENGWRRLNVLVTRARQGMRVFSSMRGDEIDPNKATSPGPHLLRKFLLFAEHGHLDSSSPGATAASESPFEREVHQELAQHGIRLQPQVGVAGYRIDFGVIDAALPGRFLCGIECDGATYHSAETARDRDRLRQQVLETRGWTIHRIWSTDWFKDRSGHIERILQHIEQTKVAAQAATEATREAQERTEASQRQAQSVALPDTAPETGPRSTPPAPLEVKPVPYVFAPTPRQYEGLEFTAAPATHLAQTITEVLSVEAPIHLKDLASRVVARWGHDRVGQSMNRYLKQVLESHATQGKCRLAGDFVYQPNQPAELPIRSRTETDIPPERIAPEEYRSAVLAVLRCGDGRKRDQLINSVRALFGFSRSGTTLTNLIGAVIDELQAEGVVGEGGDGIRLR